MNIDEMEAGPELDILIAEKVMEWQRIESAVCLTWQPPKGLLRTYEWSSYEVFRPSSRIASAWEVIEKLINGGDYLGITVDAGSHTEVYSCSFWKTWDVKWKARGDADTMPLAICRAALKAMGEQ